MQVAVSEVTDSDPLAMAPLPSMAMPDMAVALDSSEATPGRWH